jgi:uncharacterized oxidoreductase
MRLDGNGVLITGGGSGIGRALAERFLAAGSAVAICGRREETLREARERHPEIRTRVCDVARAEDREELIAWAVRELPGFNVLVNNAGVQGRARLGDPRNWSAMEAEVAVNVEAPLHLSALAVPHFVRMERAAIINVGSGLAFAPLVEAPVYSATKAAIHSFTLSLRHELAKTPIEVIEIVPPAVDTDLGGPGLHKFGVPVDELVDAVMPRLAGGELEIAYGTSEIASRAGREELEAIFRRMNGRRT